MGRSRVWTLAAVVGVVLALAACGDNQKPAEPDLDTDGVSDTEDNCPDVANPDQANRDGDGHGDVCDTCPDDANDDCSNPGAQTITFTSTAPAAVVGGAPYTVTATASSGLPVAFTIDPSAATVCSLAGSTVSFLSVGTCVINANQAGNATFQPAPQVQQTFAVGKGAQTIAFTSTAPTDAARGGATYTVAATATSGLAVSFTIDPAASSVCSIAGSTVSFEGVGTCVINANQAGDANYDAAPQVQQTFSVEKAAQTIAFTSTAPTTAEVAGATYEVSASATSGLPVAFSINATATSVCALSGATVSFIGAGTCVIDANQAGDADYSAAPVAQQTFSVGKGAQTITFTSTPPATAVFGGATYTVTATATSSLAVSFTIDPVASGVCSIASSTVSFIGAGTCVINANQGGDANYNAAPQVQQTFAVGRSAQTIAFTSPAPAAAAVEGATYTASATATSGLAVTLTIAQSAASVCSIAGSTVSFIGVGTCVIEANQAGNANYDPAPQVQQSFTVGKGAQTISFTSTPPATAVLGGPTYTVSATATSSLAVSFTIDPLAAGVCSIAGATVSFVGVGTCVINANQAGNATYNNAPQVQQSIAVGKGDQTITFTSTAPASPAVGGATYTVAATATSGLPVTFTINPSASGVCTIAGATVSFVGSGTCVIDANQAGNANYNAAPQVQQSFSVGKGAQTITFTSTAPTTAAFGGPTYTVTATASSGLPVSFTVDPVASGVCAIAGSTVSFLGVGTCVINANQAGDANHDPATQVQQSFAVGKSNQTITFVSTAPGAATVGGATYTVLGMASSALPVTLTVDASATSVCSIAGSTVSFLGAGTCVINANQAGNTSYNAAPQVQQSFTVGKGAQTVTFTSTAPASATVNGATYTVTATATSGLPVTFTIDPTASSVCSIAGATVLFTAIGTCVINANQAGNANYNAAPQVQQSFAVTGAAQTITFTSTAPVNATVGGSTYTVTATASSGLAVTFTIDPVASGVCSIAGSTVTFLSSGTCVIDANQAGNSTYLAAPQVQQSFAVAKGTQTISFTSTAPTNAVYQGTTYTVTATATSGLPVAVTIAGASAGVCSVAGTTVSFIGTGSCVINANQAGNAAYNAAPQVQQTILVGPRLVADSYSVVGNTQLVAANFVSPTTPFTITATGILANDAADVAITLTTVTNAATANGGTISIGGTGSFIYTPPPGVTGTDTYVYSGTANGVARTGTITFTITNKVWYVNSASTGAHDGRSSSPFLGLGAGANNLGTLAAAGDYIYVHKGGATTSGAHTLLANQKLIGAGATLSVGALLIPGNSANTPVLSGTLSANNVSGVVVVGTSMSTGTSTAVNLTNTDGTFTFSRITASGASNGIVWNNATAALPTSSFTVTGDGTNTTQGGNGTGGALSNMTGADGAIAGNAIYLKNVGNVALRRMVINGTNQNYGIRGFGVSNFTLEYSTVSGAFGTAASLAAPETAGEGVIYFGNTSTSGLTTAGTFTGNIINGGRGRNVSIINTTAGSTTLTFKGNSIGLNQNFADAGHSLAVEARGAGTTINTVIGGTAGEANTFTGAPGDLINVTGQTGSVIDVQMQTNSLSNNHAQNVVGGGGVTLATQGTMTFNVDGNSMRGADGDAISLQKASSGALLSGRITNNTLGVSGVTGSASKSAGGIMLSAAGTGTAALTILNNQIRNWAFAGIYLDNTGGSYAANFTIQGNTIAEPGGGAYSALAVTNGALGSSDTINVCAVIGGSSAGAKNTFAGASGRADVYAIASGAGTGHTFNLPGYVGSTLANVQTFLAGNNTISGGALYAVVADAPATAAAFTGIGSSCPTP